jgi:ADP-heptose:LPS heptosyltransferase
MGLSKYLKRHKLFNLVLFIVDTILEVFPKRDFGDTSVTPKRILLVNVAHMGDVVLSTSVLPILKCAYPDVKIGFLVGSWSRQIVQDNDMVDTVHVVDHWRLNRGSDWLVKKFLHYLSTRKRAIEELKACNYDVAIDLYTCFPSMSMLLWQAGIPIRIGYVSSGFGPLFTNRVDFPIEDMHEMDYQSRLLHELPIQDKCFEKQHSILSYPGKEAYAEFYQHLNAASLDTVKYRILHIGAGLPAKEWSLESWKKLVNLLQKDGRILVFTGIGLRENENIELVIQGAENCINLCTKLSWSSYLAAIQYAELVYCTDSLAGHLAAALDTRCVVVYSGITDQDRWRPVSDKCVLVTNHVQCAPCHNRLGCEGMQCMNGIASDSVYNAGENLFK